MKSSVVVNLPHIPSSQRLVTISQDPSFNYAKISDIIARILGSCDYFHGNKTLQFVNTKPT